MIVHRVVHAAVAVAFKALFNRIAHGSNQRLQVLLKDGLLMPECSIPAWCFSDVADSPDVL